MAKWTVGLALVLGGVSTCAVLLLNPGPATSPPATTPPAQAAAAPPVLPKEGKATYGRHQVLATFQDGTLMVVFTPPIPRDDAEFLRATKWALLELYGDIHVENASARLNGKFVRVITGAVYDVLPIKNEAGQVQALGIVRR